MQVQAELVVHLGSFQKNLKHTGIEKRFIAKFKTLHSCQVYGTGTGAQHISHVPSIAMILRKIFANKSVPTRLTGQNSKVREICMGLNTTRIH